ncbi:MAG: sigma-54-dependent transcriptional regulator [Bacteroidota bacterium]
MKGTVLIVDDEKEIRDSLSLILADEGYSCETAGDGKAAIAMLREGHYDMLITDLKMPEVGGMEVVKECQRISQQTLPIIITAYATVETAVEALRTGAVDYILKPLDFDEVILRLEQLMKQKKLAYENKYLREQVDRQFNFNHIIGESEPMKRIYKMVDRVSQATTSVLITGASGTGKELVARAIHSHSPRSNKPFIAENCGAIPESLCESELFGHKKGSFTGANEDREGIFVAANNGTLFLDEIGEIPLNTQVNLLRVLQEREVKAVGANKPRKVDVRVIAATNKNLEEEVEKGNFREDLYYRLNIVEIKLPALKERRDDIPLLVKHFVDRYNNELNRAIKGVDSRALSALMQCEWKGNVRELENVIERAVLLTETDFITVEDLPIALRENANEDAEMDLDSDALNESVQAFEKHHIRIVLRKTDGNRTEAARLMNIDPSTLYRKMERYNMMDG